MRRLALLLWLALPALANDESAGTVKDAASAMNRLGSEVARQIAQAIVNPHEAMSLDEETAGAVEYFRKWARDTATLARSFPDARPFHGVRPRSPSASASGSAPPPR